MPDQEPPRTVLQAGGRVAEEIVGGLKTQPMLLLILILNIVFLTLVYFGVEASSSRRHAEMTNLIERCFNTTGGR